MAKRILILILGFILIGIMFGCSSPEGPSGTSPNVQDPPANEVYAYDNFFRPQSLTVSVGTRVTWTNKGASAHTVTSGTRGNPDGRFNSGDMRSGATFSYTFTMAGQYTYHCIYHPGMDGTIVVQ